MSVTHTIKLIDLTDVAKRQLLRRCFTDSQSLRPDVSSQAVTEAAARTFATLAQNLRERRDRIGQAHDPQRVAHFLDRIVFCLFAEDSGLLPGGVFSAIVEEALRDRSALSDMLADLFGKMRTGKGVGIHYTDTATIMKIVEPVVLRPLEAEWKDVKAQIARLKTSAAKDQRYLKFRERLGAFRVLDPASGSGNFLYLALRHLKDFDRHILDEARTLGLTADPKGQRITPQSVLGIEINPYAAEQARVTVWIGELQWQHAVGVCGGSMLRFLSSNTCRAQSRRASARHCVAEPEPAGAEGQRRVGVAVHLALRIGDNVQGRRRDAQRSAGPSAQRVTNIA